MVPDGKVLAGRVLVLAPTPRDGDLTKSILERASIPCACFTDIEEVCRELDRGASALLLAEEALTAARGIEHWLQHQPPWSDLPLLVLARQGADSPDVARAIAVYGNVTVLERPTRVAALVSAVRSALRARERQYQIRDSLEESERTANMLRHTVEEMQKLEAALREADRRKDDFLAILAHELRNPLAPIRNAVHILRLTSNGEGPAVQVGDMLERQVTHMIRLVDDLLEVSRITRGKIELRREIVGAGAIVRSAIETSRPLIEAGKHELIVDLCGEPLSVHADPVRLAQVISNLLNNAAKYTDPGGTIELRTTRDGDQLVVAVKDSGSGIPRDMLPRIFDLFTQVDRTADRAQGGLGIGLTLVKTLVEMHGGTVEAHSDGPGHGSTFTIRLPLADTARRRANGRTTPQSTGVLRAHRILVVDDNRDAAESLGALLRLLGADVHVVFSGPDALAAIPEYKPTAVLLDIGMQGMDGYEVARRIRSEPELAALTLIALTGWGQDEDRRRSHSAGFDHHLTKPADVLALQHLLASIADREAAVH